MNGVTVPAEAAVPEAHASLNRSLYSPRPDPESDRTNFSSSSGSGRVPAGADERGADERGAQPGAPTAEIGQPPFRIAAPEGEGQDRGAHPMTRPIRRARPMCRSCNRRPALACVRGEWRVVQHHDVCRQCWRSLMDSRRAERLAALERDRKAVGRPSRGTGRGTEVWRGREATPRAGAV